MLLICPLSLTIIISSHCTVKKVRPYLFVKFIQIFVSEFQQKTKKLCLLVLAQIL